MKRYSLLIRSITFAIFFALGFLTVSRVHAADLGYRWYSSYITLKSLSSAFNTATNNTRNDYHNNTDLSVYIEYSDPDVVVNYGDHGPMPWQVGNAVAQNVYGQDCASWWNGTPTGDCNTSNKKAITGTIYLNNHYGAIPSNRRDFVMRHEFGHIFGMAHVYGSGCWSVMHEGYCVDSYGISNSNLRQADINQLNSWY